MDSCDVVIVGGGPAGSSCAWKLRNSGLDIMMLDKQKFPRHKACGGWVTPGVFQELGLDPAEYARGRVFQPIFGFRTCCMGGPVVETRYDHAVSYGVRRYEFDQFLVERAGVWLQDGEELTSLERNGDGWVINKGLKTSLIVGAGGHFCPVAQFLGAKPSAEPAVVAQEAEIELEGEAMTECAIEPEFPELYFFPDMKGYGWCLRKGKYLNIGLRRPEQSQFSAHVHSFLSFLGQRKKLPADVSSMLQGQGYLLYGPSTRRLVGDRVLLVGDAAGLAYELSGEGIRPAVESGLLAARTIVDAKRDYRKEKLERYRLALVARHTPVKKDRVRWLSQVLPAGLKNFLGRQMLGSIRFSREILLNRWFLHADEPPFLY